MTYKIRIADMVPSERPREKLLATGATNLSDAELLAILLGTGQGRGDLSAVGLAQFILNELSVAQRNPMEVLRHLNPQELTTIKGIGPAKAATIAAAIELGKRTFWASPNQRTVIDSPESGAAVLSKDLMWEEQERFALLMLNVKNELLGSKVITIGTATETLVHPREVFREAIKQGATKLIIAHNHPSGSVQPSPEDITLTQRLLEVAQVVAIPILDHLILGSGHHQSLRQITDLWQSYPQ